MESWHHATDPLVAVALPGLDPEAHAQNSVFNAPPPPIPDHRFHVPSWASARSRRSAGVRPTTAQADKPSVHATPVQFGMSGCGMAAFGDL